MPPTDPSRKARQAKLAAITRLANSIRMQIPLGNHRRCPKGLFKEINDLFEALLLYDDDVAATTGGCPELSLLLETLTEVLLDILDEHPESCARLRAVLDSEKFPRTR